MARRPRAISGGGPPADDFDGPQYRADTGGDRRSQRCVGGHGIRQRGNPASGAASPALQPGGDHGAASPDRPGAGLRPQPRRGAWRSEAIRHLSAAGTGSHGGRFCHFPTRPLRSDAVPAVETDARLPVARTFQFSGFAGGSLRPVFAGRHRLRNVHRLPAVRPYAGLFDGGPDRGDGALAHQPAVAGKGGRAADESAEPQPGTSLQLVHGVRDGPVGQPDQGAGRPRERARIPAGGPRAGRAVGNPTRVSAFPARQARQED